MGRFSSDVVFIAFDFDGTLTENTSCVERSIIRSRAVAFVEFLSRYEFVHLLLWTCRSGELLEGAKSTLREAGILDCFRDFNTNSRVDYGSRKIYYDYLIDDLSISWDGFSIDKFIRVLGQDSSFVSRGISLWSDLFRFYKARVLLGEEG